MTVANYAENKILDALFNNVSLAVATPYIKLHIGDPGEDCTANAAVETTRKLVSFGVAASGQVASDADLTWTPVAATEVYTYVSLWDASTAGNALWSGPLTVPRSVSSGDTFTIPSGSLVVSLD
jgi:hypothetical protein